MTVSRNRIHKFTAQFILLLVAIWQLSIWLTPGIANEGSVAEITQPKEITLSNGLKVLILEDKSFPVVSCAMWYRAGSRNDRMGKTGVAHLVEHLLFKNVGSFKDDSLQSAIIRNGGVFNGYTSDDFTVFYETLPASKLELALKIEAERMGAAAFTQADVQDEVSRIEREFKPGVQDELELLEREVRAALYRQHPYRNPPRGWLSDVKKLNLQDAQQFYNMYYRPDNATLVIAGGISGDSVMPLIESYFGKVVRPDVSIPEVEGSEVEQLGERRITLRHPGKANIIQIAYNAPSLSESDAAACAVLEQHFNAALSGLVKSALLDKKLCSKATVAFESRQYPGLFTITCYLKSGVGLDSVLSALDGSIDEVKSEELTDDELRRAKNLAEFEFARDRDGPFMAAFQLGFFDSLDKWSNTYDWAEKIHRVKSSDVQRVANRCLNSNSRVVGYLLNAAAAKTSSLPSAKKVASRQTIGSLCSRLCAYKDDAAAGAEVIPASQRNVVPLMVEDETGTATGKQVVVDAPINPVMGRQPSAGIPARIEPRKAVQLFSPSIQERILSNGLKLVVFENHLSPILEIRGAVRAGSVFDPQGKDGMSALTTILLNSGSDDTDELDMKNEQERMGLPPSAMLAFFSDPETIRFKSQCLSRDFRNQLNILAETLTDPNVKDSSIASAKTSLQLAIGDEQKNLYSRINRALKASLLSKGSPYCPANLTVLSRSISRLTENDIENYTRRFIRPENTIIVVSGDITLMQAVRQLEEVFEDWRPTGEPPVFPPTQKSKRQIRRTSLPVKDNSWGILCFGQLLPVVQTSQEYGQVLLADCLLANHPFMSRLDKLFSQDEVLAPDVRDDSFESGLSDLGHKTLWSLKLKLSPHLIPYAIKTINAELRSITGEGVRSQEVAESRRYLLGSVPVGQMATLPDASKNILESIIAGGDAHFLPGILNGIRTATVASVNNVIRQQIRPDKASLVIAADGQTIRAVRKHSLAVKKRATHE